GTAASRRLTLILTWHQAQVELIGVLDDMEHRAEVVLRPLLEVEAIHEPGCRPLHILIATVLADTFDAAAPVLMGAMTPLGAKLQYKDI
ncbi:MAG: hypothetical protein ACREU6_12855, partial [Steroidobacteraceae bacterium]